MESCGLSAARLSALCGMVGLLAFTLLTICDVLMRWLFKSPIAMVSDVAPLIIVVVVAALFPYALAERYHIAMEFLGSTLGLRTRLWLKAIVALVTLVFFVLLAWQIVVYTIDLHERGQTTWVVQIPAAPWWVVVSFFMILCVLVQLGIFLIELFRAIKCDGTGKGGRRALEDPPLTDSGAR